MQRVFNFLGKHSLGADLSQRNAGDLVARGLDDFNLRSVPFSAQQSGYMVRLRNANCEPLEPIRSLAIYSFGFPVFKLNSRLIISWMVAASG